MRGKVRTPQRILAAVAQRQHGVATRRQLIAAGLSAPAIDRLLAAGSLLRQHRGVYRVGHRAPSLDARYLGAVLACGDGALLCDRASGHLLHLLRGKPPPPEVTAPTERRVPGVRVRRSRNLIAADGFVFRGIPVTTVPRTLVDLAALLADEELASACHEAGVHFGTTPRQVEAVLARLTPVPGAGRLRGVMLGETRVTLSKLERRFIERLVEAGLPLPKTNRVAGGRRVDCRWPEHRLTVELDSYRYHGSRHAWERDRRREREAHARGDDFRRYTFGDVFDHPRPMLRELAVLLL